MANMAYLPRLLYRSFCTSAASETTNPSLPSLKTLVNDLFDERNLKKLVEKFKKSSEHNRFRSKHRVYETTIRRLASAKRFSYIEEILEDQKKYREMSKEGFAIRLISLYGKSETIWDRMEKNNLVPDVRTLNVKVRGLILMGKMSDAVKLVEELDSKGLKPDVHSFNALIDGFCKDGNVEEAKRFYNELLKNESIPNRLTLETLVPSLCEKGEFDMALKMCMEGLSRRCYVDAWLLQVLVDGLVKESKIEEAKTLVALARLKQYGRSSLKMPDDVESK